MAEARTPSLSIRFPRVTPGNWRSTRKRAMCFIPRSREVLAQTVSMSATGALVTQVLVPLSRQPPSARSAKVAMPATSEPAFGSVRAKVAIFSPRRAGTR